MSKPLKKPIKTKSDDDLFGAAEPKGRTPLKVAARSSSAEAGYTAADIETWSQVMARSIRAAGGRPGMKVHVAYGYGLFTGGLGAHYGAEKLGCTVVPVSGGMTERQVQLICDFEPDIIMVTPSYMLAILDEFRRLGIDTRKTSLKVGMGVRLVVVVGRGRRAGACHETR